MWKYASICFQSLNFTRHTAVSIAILIKNQPLKTCHSMVILFIPNITLLMTLNVSWHNVIFKGWESTKFLYFTIFIIYTISESILQINTYHSSDTHNYATLWVLNFENPLVGLGCSNKRVCLTKGWVWKQKGGSWTSFQTMV